MKHLEKAKKFKKRLTDITAVLSFYGNVMDMLVQHHPEYVSLAWGAMKFLIVVSFKDLVAPPLDIAAEHNEPWENYPYFGHSYM